MFVVEGSDRCKLSFTTSVIARVREINTRALKLSSLSGSDLQAAVDTYALSAAQAQDQALDVVTGFIVHQPHQTLVVLEGLSSGSLQRYVWRGNEEKK